MLDLLEGASGFNNARQHAYSKGSRETRKIHRFSRLAKRRQENIKNQAFGQTLG